MRGYLKTVRSIPAIGWILLGLSFLPGLVIGAMVGYQAQSPELQGVVAILATVVIAAGIILVLHVDELMTKRYLANYWAKRGRTDNGR